MSVSIIELTYILLGICKYNTADFMLTLYLNLVSQVLFSFSDDKFGTVGFGTQTMGMARDNSTSWLGGCCTSSTYPWTWEFYSEGPWRANLA